MTEQHNCPIIRDWQEIKMELKQAVGDVGGSTSPPTVGASLTIYAYHPQSRPYWAGRDYRGTYSVALSSGINNRRALLFDAVHCLTSTTTLATIFAAVIPQAKQQTF